MIITKDVVDFINVLSPFETQEGWDNSGFLVGDLSKPCKRIALCLDITPDAVRAAGDVSADLIISHHPVIFGSKKNFYSGEPSYELARLGIGALCAHTCLDKARGGVNDALLEKLGLHNDEGIECEEPFLRFAKLQSAADAPCLAKYIKERLECENVRYCDSGREIKTVAVCSGSGADFLYLCQSRADALITGDAGHHDFLSAIEMGISLFAAGHFETENPVIPSLEKIINAKFPEIETVIIKQSSPIKNI